MLGASLNPTHAGNHARRRSGRAIPAVLLGVAAVGWVWSAIAAGQMTSGSSTGRMGSASTDMMGSESAATFAISLAGFMIAWLAMMAAMMLPAVTPVVRLYGRAAARGAAAPAPVFAAGYLAVWTAIGLPAFFAWRALSEPLARGDAWVADLAAAVLLAAALYQLTPLKTACLRHCRSPLSFFLNQRGDLRAPTTALRMGVSHGLVCLGCCWALMAILVALGTMQIGAMLVLAALILVEKNTPHGMFVARAVPVVMVGVAVALVANPGLISQVG
jgi:predicted metal-binding membrane protein